MSAVHELRNPKERARLWLRSIRGRAIVNHEEVVQTLADELPKQDSVRNILGMLVRAHYMQSILTNIDWAGRFAR